VMVVVDKFLSFDWIDVVAVKYEWCLGNLYCVLLGP